MRIRHPLYSRLHYKYEYWFNSVYIAIKTSIYNRICIALKENYCKQLEENVKDLKNIVYSMLGNNKHYGTTEDKEIKQRGTNREIKDVSTQNKFPKLDVVAAKSKEDVSTISGLQSKPFVCDKCGNKFGYPHTLRRHKIQNCKSS